MDTRVNVRGIREVRNLIEQLDPEAGAEITEALRHATETIAKDARARIPQRSGAAAGAIKAVVAHTVYGTHSASNARIEAGKKQVPYYGWLDFGARTPVRGNPRSVGPWAKSGKGPAGGRYLYPAINHNIDRVADEINDAIISAIQKVGLDG